MSSQSNTKRRNTTTPEKYAEGSLYGLKFSNEIQDIVDFDRKLNCTPDLSFLDSNTKVLLDYSSCTNTTEDSFLLNILNGISLGDGFTIENGEYIDPISGEECNLSGRYTYSATYADAIVANVDSVDTILSLNKRYFSEGFNDDFNIIFTVSNPDLTEKNQATNYFGPGLNPSFTSLGLKTNDYVRFDSGTNSGKLLKVESFYIDENNNEVLLFGTTADFIDEDRFNVRTDVSLYRIDNSDDQLNRIQYDSNGEVLLTSNTLYVNGLVTILNVAIVNNKFSVFNYTAPNLVLYTGASYIFNTSGLILSDHSFRISSTNDGVWNGGKEHPEIEVYDNFVLFNPKTSGTFYYYCEKHPNMGAVIKIENKSVNQILQERPSYVDDSLLTQDINNSFTNVFYL